MWPGIPPTDSLLLLMMLFVCAKLSQVSRLFTKITELVEEEDSLVFVLIDEVESLTSARKVRTTIYRTTTRYGNVVPRTATCRVIVHCLALLLPTPRHAPYLYLPPNVINIPTGAHRLTTETLRPDVTV